MTRPVDGLLIETGGSAHTRFDSYFPPEQGYSNTAGHDATRSTRQSNDEEDHHDLDFASLPFPAPLHSLRRDFRAQDFDADTFLCQHQKHGQLDDLLAELRALARQLDGELTAGVQRDYASFIQLGQTDASKLVVLQQGASAIRQQAQVLADEAMKEAEEADDVLRQRAVIREMKAAARQQLWFLRGVDELASIMEDGRLDEEGLQLAVDLAARLRHREPRTTVPAATTAAFEALRQRLVARLREATQQGSDADKLRHAQFIRRLYA
ncbi:hypothetical protein BCR37DRAFT_394361 [Protomyces lactucae-debilis]|uniref:Conserved oligomeric Golgi complex subunit 2 n=1 Tax=Protomyces lactucae-debilis TaxID=2754530 RepID=A0A1Y2F517_PROLT|nr:uncharacterized protein BCR37DRAFT_394361 [Protomyces lactucae-debilis]ORY79018.1 hypothetical protein BCR37DRAFT_394361 [Protomyces lactucae-debilis]